MNAPLPHHATSNCAIADDPLVLTRIFDPEIQLAQWRRPAKPVIADWLAAHANDLGSGLRQTLTPGQPPDLGRLPAGAGRDALTADIALLAEMFGELLDAASIGFRLEVVGKAMCPRLHVDRVGIRLLCTYRGPGTGWVEDASVDRRFLGAASGGSRMKRPACCLPGIGSRPLHPSPWRCSRAACGRGMVGGAWFTARQPSLPSRHRVFCWRWMPGGNRSPFARPTYFHKELMMILIRTLLLSLLLGFSTFARAEQALPVTVSLLPQQVFVEPNRWSACENTCPGAPGQESGNP